MKISKYTPKNPQIILLCVKKKLTRILEIYRTRKFNGIEIGISAINLHPFPQFEQQKYGKSSNLSIKSNPDPPAKKCLPKIFFF